MKVLLFSMPDSFEHMYSGAIRMPNGALSSLAGNVDPHHEVAVADLILVQGRVRETVERLLRERDPDVVGLSVMTFQRRTARRIVEIVRGIRPQAAIVLGGYDPSLAPEAWTDGTADFVVRGEGELTFRDLLRALEGDGRFENIAGLVWRNDDQYVTNVPRPVNGLENGQIRPPRRSARVLSGYTLLGRPVDVIETSRGCTYDCSFCSIIEMRGRNFHTFSFERVLADIRDAVAHGARALFIVDDNITLNVARFEALCRAIVDARLHGIEYMVQGMTSSIANAGDTLAPLMRHAGFRYVFLGIENVLEQDLGFLKASAKNAKREHGRRTGNATIAAIDALHKNGLYVVGGLIVGNPGDTRESVEANLEFARRYVDWPYIQHPTPYPGTPMTRDLRDQGLIVSDRMEEYDGTTAVVRSEGLSTDEIEFLRWKRERWMKVRHFPTALFRRPGFVMRHGRAMLAHTFRGSTWRSWMGLEPERTVFDRYRAIRQMERDSVV
jgi:radical SAM superfamily enzyme YgiQ (UPF0313 family)